MTTKHKTATSGKAWLTRGIKITIGVVLVTYVLKKGLVNFSALALHLQNPWNLVIAFSIFFLANLSCSLRAYFLASRQGLGSSKWTIFELTMIGNFFNTFLPGAVGGDLIKAWYFAGREAKKKTKAVLVVFFDRCIGLWVILVVAAFTLLLHREVVMQSVQLSRLASALWTIVLTCAMVWLGGRFWGDSFQGVCRRILKGRSRRSLAWMRTVLSFFQLNRNTCFALGLSALNLFGIIFLFWYLGTRLDLGISLSDYFFLVPISLTVAAVPILPGGFGAAQVAFFSLLTWLGAPNPELGSTLCTLYQIYFLLFSLFGGIFYLKFRRHPETFV